MGVPQMHGPSWLPGTLSLNLAAPSSIPLGGFSSSSLFSSRPGYHLPPTLKRRLVSHFRVKIIETSRQEFPQLPALHLWMNLHPHPFLSTSSLSGRTDPLPPQGLLPCPCGLPGTLSHRFCPAWPLHSLFLALLLSPALARVCISSPIHAAFVSGLSNLLKQ